MRSPRTVLVSITALATAAGLVAAGLVTAGPSNAALGNPTALRVDQVGYGAGEAKQAYLMSGVAAPGAPFAVVDDSGTTVFAGKAGASRGTWNDQYTAVHPLDFTGLRRPGTYRIKAGASVSPPFRIASTTALFGPLAHDSTHFFQVNRSAAAGSCFHHSVTRPVQ